MTIMICSNVIAVFVILEILITKAKITYGLSCYGCVYDRFNKSRNPDTEEDCLHTPSLIASDCGVVGAVDENDNDDDTPKVTTFGNWSSIETFNFDIYIEPRPVCYLELSMVNGEIVRLIRACRISSQPSTCEFMERKGKAQKAKIAMCYCHESGCNFPTHIEQLSLIYIGKKSSSGAENIWFTFQNNVFTRILLFAFVWFYNYS